MIKPVLRFESNKKFYNSTNSRNQRVGETEEKLSGRSYHFPGIVWWKFFDRKQEKKKSTSYK